MPKTADILYYIVHYDELRALIQWNLWHHPVHERDEDKEPVTLRRCFAFLDKTSRSFSAVIKELHPELLVPVCLFYLILRGLDTIEDDMSIPLEEKDRVLRSFHTILEQDGWNYSGNHATMKDRELVVEFDVVVAEFKKVKPVYRDIISDITEKMGNGMADYAKNAELNVNGINTIKDYEKYCHYVAGLVGEGLTRLFVESKLANPALLSRPHLHDSMGQFLQQVNIIRDIREDFDDKRKFWPKEIWSKYVDKFDDLFDEARQEAALNCSSEMILVALNRADECLFYLAGLRDQSVFNFAAIPQSMAIATLALCFRNPDIFKRNVKISKGQACQLMIESTQNLQLVCEVFRTYTRKIHFKNDPRDPNFLSISIACGKIEQFIEQIFPSQVPPGKGKDTTGKILTPEEDSKAKAKREEERWDSLYLFGALLLVLVSISAIMLGVAWFAGARFDIAFDRLRLGRFLEQILGAPQGKKIPGADDHAEL